MLVKTSALPLGPSLRSFAFPVGSHANFVQEGVQLNRKNTFFLIAQ
jgi:hypothetical protein